MPTFPNTFPQVESTKPSIRGGVMVRTATNGASRPRVLSSGKRKDWVLVLWPMTQDQLDALEDFYDANRGTAFDVELWADDSTLACYFRDPPYDYTPVTMGGGTRYYRVQVNLIAAA